MRVISALAQPFHSFWIFLCSSAVVYWTPSDLGRGGGHLLVSHIFAFSYSSRASRQEYQNGFAFPFSSGPRFIRALHYDPSILGGLTRMAHSFIELCKPLHHNKAVVHCGGLVAKLCPTLVTPWTVAGQAPLSMGFPR